VADTNTANLALLLPDLNDTFNFGAHVENNFSTIDALMGAVQCTSSARPSNTYAGQIVYETDSKRYAQNTGSKASPSWTYMSHQAMTCTSGSRPSSGVGAGEIAYETDTAALIVATGSSTWRYRSNVSCTSITRPTGAIGAGTTIFETDTGRSMVYNGANWVPQGQMLMATPVTTSTLGTAGSSTTGTEVFDAVLGYYQCALVSGRRYQATVNGLIGNGGVALDTYSVQIRDSQSASNPTSASALIAQSQWEAAAAGGAGRDTISLGETFLCTVTGTHTFGVSYTKLTGTGAFTPVGNRELFVEDMGAAY
jgi:hypothetical protein